MTAYNVTKDIIQAIFPPELGFPLCFDSLFLVELSLTFCYNIPVGLLFNECHFLEYNVYLSLCIFFYYLELHLNLLVNGLKEFWLFFQGNSKTSYRK